MRLLEGSSMSSRKLNHGLTNPAWTALALTDAIQFILQDNALYWKHPSTADAMWAMQA